MSTTTPPSAIDEVIRIHWMHGLVRTLIGIAIGLLMTFLLYWLMSALVAAGKNALTEAPAGRIVDFVRVPNPPQDARGGEDEVVSLHSGRGDRILGTPGVTVQRVDIKYPPIGGYDEDERDGADENDGRDDGDDGDGDGDGSERNSEQGDVDESDGLDGAANDDDDGGGGGGGRDESDERDEL